jgi:predicted anti-sigma-YlaC factor YlaD
LQAHLETCSACRAELAELRQLSTVLRSAELPADLMPANQFVDQLAGRLPPRPAAREWLLPVSRAGWLAPVALLVLVVFNQVVSVLTTLFTAASASGQLGDLGAWLAPGAGQTLWFSAAQLFSQNVLSLNLPDNLQAANDLLVSLQQWLINPLLWQFVVTLAYFAGLAVWLASRREAGLKEQDWKPIKE